MNIEYQLQDVIFQARDLAGELIQMLDDHDNIDALKDDIRALVKEKLADD